MGGKVNNDFPKTGSYYYTGGPIMEEEGGTEATFNVIVTSEELLAFRLLKSDYQHIIIDLMVVNR